MLGTARRSSARLQLLAAADAETRRVDMATRGLVDGDWLASIACMFCRHPGDSKNMLLCDLCGGGCHWYCGPAPSARLPPSDGTLWLCTFCRSGESASVSHVLRPPPMANLGLQARIGEAARAGYAGTTTAHDDVIFAHFVEWCHTSYGFALVANVEYFNSDQCRRHRVESLAGFLACAHEGPRRNAGALFHSLRRSFALHSLRIDAFVPNGTAAMVVRGAAVLHPSVLRPKTVGATVAMIAQARQDASVSLCDPPGMLRRMLGLSAIYSYAVGARISELATTRVAVSGGWELNKHTVLRSMVRYCPPTLEIFPTSTKTTGPSRRRPDVLIFRGGDGAASSEIGLNAFLFAEITRFLADAGGLPVDPVFSFRHGIFLKCLTRDALSSYTKELGSAEGLHPDWCSTKTWKVGRVSHGVERGCPETELLARGNHRSSSSSKHYRPSGRAAVVFCAAGISRELALGEISRDRFRLGLDMSDSDSD